LISVLDELGLAPRNRNAHKGDFGRVLIVAGSRGLTGAAVLAAGACLRSGAGLVTVAAPASVMGQIAASHPAAMTWPLAETSTGRVSLTARSSLMARLATFDAVAVGPGLGRSAGVTALVVSMFNECPVPLVLDADALNSLAEGAAHHRLRFFQGDRLSVSERSIRVLSPHFGEYRRLRAAMDVSSSGMGVGTCETEPDESVMSLATKLGSWIILKGPETRITDGTSMWRNPTGNPGLATGGSGDCLTGVLVACLGNCSDPSLALRRACYVHGLAGDLAAMQNGQHSMNAEDLVDYLPAAWKSLENSR
jgi:ADP-dependent NAD(P)H-hydrate dehydratase